MACCVARKAAKKEARAALGAKYDSREPLLPGKRCPIDGTSTQITYFVLDMVTLGYLVCAKDHALPLRKMRCP